MKKFVVRTLMICTLVSTVFMSGANASGDCSSFETKSGGKFTVCYDGDAKKGALAAHVKSELLEIAHQLKRNAAKRSKRALRRREFGSYGSDVKDVKDYGTDDPIVDTPSYGEDPDYGDDYSSYGSDDSYGSDSNYAASKSYDSPDYGNYYNY